MNTIDENTLNANFMDAPEDTQAATANVESVETKKEQVAEQPAQHGLGKLEHMPGKREIDKEEAESFSRHAGMTELGGNLFGSAEIREGWIDVNKALLGPRANFYPETWQFRIKPATVEAIRNWSMIDNENPNVVDDVFNEILKSCLSILTPTGVIPWGNVRSWDRFFFLLLIREYTFIQGEKKIEYQEDCPNCDNPVTFNLESGTLLYDLPDQEIVKYFSVEDQTWVIDPAEFEVEGYEPITLYLPTLEKDANIKAWMIDRLQNKKKVDNVFIKFLPWLAPTISKDLTVAQRQIREYEIKYKSWNTDMFDFMDEVIKNIIVMPSTKLITKCPTCGEEVTSEIRFPNGVNDLFNISNRRKKFGNK